MIAIINYGVGNLFSLQSSFAAIGQEAVVTSDEETIRRADRVILPGVGAFRDAALKLRDSGMDRVVKREAAAGKPLLGICLGMQLLFERSFEYGEHEGLSLLKGEIRPIAERIPAGLKIPQMQPLCHKGTHTICRLVHIGMRRIYCNIIFQGTGNHPPHRVCRGN